MSTSTTNFGIVLPEGTDTFNPLTFENNAFTRVDEVMKVNQDRGITPATHSFLEGIHTILRTVSTCPTLVFVASADWTATDSIAVDGVTMTLRYADGSLPGSNAFRTNQAVMCYVNGTILTLISCTGEEAVKAKIQALTDIIGDAADLPDPEASVVENVAELNNNLSGKATSKVLATYISNRASNINDTDGVHFIKKGDGSIMINGCFEVQSQIAGGVPFMNIPSGFYANTDRLNNQLWTHIVNVTTGKAYTVIGITEVQPWGSSEGIPSGVYSIHCVY